MRFNISKEGGNSGGFTSSGGALTGPLILAGNPTQPLEAATKQYVDNGLAALNAINLTSGTYAKVTVDAKGRVTAGSALSATDISNLGWSKITTGKPTTLSGYGITNGVSKAGDTMTAPLTLSEDAANPLHAVPLPQVNALASIGGDPEFIASGSIPNAGLTVGLNADGTVSVIAGIASPDSWGTEVVFNNTNTFAISAVYDSTNNKVVIAYGDYINGIAVVGTISGTNISFGSPVVFNSAYTTDISAVYDPINNKVVIAYGNTVGNLGTAIVGTVTGNTISFGTPVVFSSDSTAHISTVYDSTNNKVVIAYNNGYGTAVVGTVTGNSILFGTPVVFNSAYTNYMSAVYDPTNGKVVIAYNNGYGTAIVGTVTGNTISFGTPVVFNNAFTADKSIAYDPTNNKVVIAYGNSSNGTAIVYSPYINTNNQNTFIGIAQQSATNGSPVRVKVKESVDSNQSGLTPGQLYYVTDNGTLTTTSSNNFLVGKAISANKLHITNWSIN